MDSKKIQTGVNFRPEIIEYIDHLRSSNEHPEFYKRSRSNTINIIIEEYARQRGEDIYSSEHNNP